MIFYNLYYGKKKITERRNYGDKKNCTQFLIKKTTYRRL